MEIQDGTAANHKSDRFRIALILSVPLMGIGIFVSIVALVDPLSLPWADLSEPVVVPITKLDPLQTLSQIKAELTDSQLTLGDRLSMLSDRSNYSIFPLLDLDTKEIREIRVYQSVSESFWEDDGKDSTKEKLRLLRKIEVSGLESSVVRSPAIRYKYPKDQAADKTNLPLKKLQAIAGSAPSQGIWFMAVGQIDENNNFGKVFCYMPNQATLNMNLEWSSLGKFPEWQNFIQSPVQADSNNSPELVLDQTQNFDPQFQVFRLETLVNRVNPLQLRQITLNEEPKMPKAYNQALLLASSGLWSPALSQLDILKSELASKGDKFSAYAQEQYDLIAFHAKITREQAQQVSSDSGEQALKLVIDGQWQEGIRLAEASDFGGKSVMEMLAERSSHIWTRVETMLEIETSRDFNLQTKLQVKKWGSLVILQRQGLVEATAWLRAQNGEVAIALLQRLDLSPLGIEPQQLIGTVKYLGGNSVLDQRWQQISPLSQGLAWYEVDVNVLLDRTKDWLNAPFPEIIGRSPLMVWRALGMEQNSYLSISITNKIGLTQTISLTAQSVWISDQGRLKILASGSETAAIAFDNPDNLITPMVTGGGVFIPATGSSTYLEFLDKQLINKITNAIYAELQSLGQVSLNREEFGKQLTKVSFKSVNLTGSSKPDLVLEIDRRLVDLGDRHYPMAIAFTGNGDLLFSDISPNARRRWISLLPGSSPFQILTEVGGTYEVWSLR
jgi:hypothetical protein